MGIKVHLGPYYHYTNNQRLVEVSGKTVKECLSNLGAQFPDFKLFDRDGNILSYIDIWLNDEIVYSKSMNKPVKDGDEIVLRMMSIGG